MKAGTSRIRLNDSQFGRFIARSGRAALSPEGDLTIAVEGLPQDVGRVAQVVDRSPGVGGQLVERHQVALAGEQPAQRQAQGADHARGDQDLRRMAGNPVLPQG